RLPAAAQNDMAVPIAFGDEDCRLSMLGVAEKVVRLACRQDGLDRDLHIARGSVFEAHRAGESGDQLAVHLTLCGTRTDGAPANEARDILRRDHVEKLRARGNAHLCQVEQQMPRLAQTVVY